VTANGTLVFLEAMDRSGTYLGDLGGKLLVFQEECKMYFRCGGLYRDQYSYMMIVKHVHPDSFLTLTDYNHTSVLFADGKLPTLPS